VENLVLQGSADLQGYGNELANTLTRNTGIDLLSGGAGEDTYVVNNPNDAVLENANEGTDTVHATVPYRLSANVENLVLDGSENLQGYGNGDTNTLTGNSGNNLLNGEAGADTMVGGAGNDTYFVDNAGDLVFENSNEGTDAVFATVSYTLPANVETLVLQGSADLQGSGNNQANTIYGNAGNNLINGGAGADTMLGGAGNDTFVFHAGEANGDTVVDFNGGGAAEDSMTFIGFGTLGQGATFTQIGAAEQWQIHSGLDGHDEIISFTNNATVQPSDFLFS
jgi:Ca2+-binding RTX toxin-like protein